jgi:cytochrome c
VTIGRDASAAEVDVHRRQNDHSSGRTTMHILHPALAAGLVSLSLISSPALADPAKDTAMLKLAASSGCTVCHSVEPSAKTDGSVPVGPPWRDVAARYFGVKDAQSKLTQIVLHGSSPYSSHWKGKVGGLAMPPNEVAISEADANKLVGWILSLDVR